MFPNCYTRSTTDSLGLFPQALTSTAENIKIFVRIRPLSETEISSSSLQCLSVEGSNTVLVRHPSIGLTGGRVEQQTFDYVGDQSTTQEKIFLHVGKSMTEYCLQGYNATIFAYGQTGSGKTYTMLGPTSTVLESDIDSSLVGIIPRILVYLFEHISNAEKDSTVQYICKCSMIEIYNEVVYDLLDPSTPTCTLREDVMKKNVFVEGALELRVVSAKQALDLLSMGARNRTIGATALNKESSRSHSVFILHIQSRMTDPSTGITDVRDSRFNLVDLAGSERQTLAQTSGTRLREAGSINKSLLALANVMNGLVASSPTFDLGSNFSTASNGLSRKQHISYRDSKLTFLLKDSLGGNAKTLIITNVSPSLSAYSESISSLRFAQRAKLVRNIATVNKDILGSVGSLQAEIARLKEALASKEHSTTNLGHSNPNFNHMYLKKIVYLNKELTNMRSRFEMLEDLLSKKEQQLQSEKMIVKFRDAEISTLKNKKNDDPSLQSESIKRLEAELLESQRMQRMNPEISRLVYENTQLTARIQALESFASGLDEFSIKDEEQTIRVIQEAEEYLLSDFNENNMQLDDTYKDPSIVQKLEKFKSENQILKEEIDALRESSNPNQIFEDFQSELSIKDTEIRRLENIISTLSETTTSVPIKKQASSSEDSLNSQTTIILNLQKEVELVKEINSNVNFELSKTESAMLKTLSEKEKLSSLNASLETELLSLSSMATNLEKENLQLKEAISVANEAIAESETRVSASEASRITILDRCSLLEDKLFASETRSGTLSAKLLTLEENFSSISSELSLSLTEIKSKESEKLELKNQLQLSSDQINFLKAHSSQLESIINEKESLIVKLEYSIGDLRNSITDLRSNIADLQNTVSECENRLDLEHTKVVQYESQIQLNQGFIQKLQDELSISREENVKLTQKCQIIQVDLDETLKKLSDIRVNYDTLTTCYQNKISELKDSLINYDHIANELLSTKNTLTEKNLVCQEMVNQIKELSSEKSQYIKDIELLSLKLSKLASENSSLLSEREVLANKISILESEKIAEIEIHQKTLELLEKANVQIDQLNLSLSSSKTEQGLLSIQLSTVTAEKDKSEKSELGARTAFEFMESNHKKILAELEEKKNEIHHLQMDVASLKDENDKLVQHQNAKQKLQYHVKIKQENNDLKEEIRLLKEEIIKLASSSPHISPFAQKQL